MTNEYEWERKNILERLPGYDPSFVPIHYAAWNDYEEHAYMFILRKDRQLYLLNFHHCVLAQDNHEYWDPIPVNNDEALEWMLEWEQYEEHDC